MYDGTIYVAGKVKSLGIDCILRRVDGRGHRADRAQVPDLRTGSPPEFQKFVCGSVLYNYDSLEPLREEAGDLMTTENGPGKRDVLGHSRIFTPEVINDIHIKSELGRYRMRGFSIFKPMPHWDELVFLPGTLTRFVIEGYREKCDTTTVLGARFAKNPLELDIPIYITGMSFGALSLEAKMALAKGASMAGTATCSGEGGMIRWSATTRRSGTTSASSRGTGSTCTT